jgi:hypothetical protein
MQRLSQAMSGPRQRSPDEVLDGIERQLNWCIVLTGINLALNVVILVRPYRLEALLR